MSTAGGGAIHLATNNGDIGGGEVMLLHIAEALQALDVPVHILAPSGPDGVVAEAARRHFDTVPLPASGRRSYMSALARWRLRHPAVPLWCNGLVPALATAGIGPRIVHLHKLPEGQQRRALALARTGARRVLVPSVYLADQLRDTAVFPDWTAALAWNPPRPVAADRPVRIGFMGRLTQAKGVDVLARACHLVESQVPGGIRLVLAGENRFGESADDAALRDAIAPLGAVIERRGWMAPEDFFAAVDIAAFPSVEPESFGLVVAEAMASGTPFVISDVEGFREVAGPDHPWVARRGDHADLAHTLLRAITSCREDPQGEGRRSARARRRWELLYSPRAGARRTADLLLSLPGGER